ncbi:DUF397 domain-containing protein [Actinacidiphila oryziradicis]|jgi:hypothetical protein|uniref:DUF397 domain-containing protein n=1 Tax=Actinacidiphila oryziradicis TaxID=2571141 RepID=A0A4U0STG8_9ACTN|nr:DUF397 domain-containing protein [Actinacidiphila oryziradicis]MCW2872209.1 hypothetical protein [Actinacidiphila oryziradicis]TKA12788.1 DUF397 domain-containing protein [Actinacidiphila oryziradicis]
MHPIKADLYAIDPTTLTWQKSSFTGNNGECFELAPLPGGGVAVRDSKNPAGPHLCFTPGEWSAFKQGMAAGDFDNL